MKGPNATPQVWHGLLQVNWTLLAFGLRMLS